VRIWVDADALPNEIKEIILRASARLGIETVLVANKNVSTGGGALVSLVRVDAGPDVADGYIVDSSAPGDLCVTADVPLAARLVDKGVVAIDPRGQVYADGTIGERLSVRDFMAGLRDAGMVTGGPPPFDQRAKQRFASTFDRLLTKAVREASG
jgi:uncharacterized protein YaiI (UPF0178 family)